MGGGGGYDGVIGLLFVSFLVVQLLALVGFFP